MSGIVPVGVSTWVQASATAANVQYGPNISNTFRIVNQDNSMTLYAAVYNDATLASAFAKPSVSNKTVPGVIAIAPGWNETVSGNFGAQNTNPVYVCVVTSASGTVDCVITPVRD